MCVYACVFACLCVCARHLVCHVHISKPRYCWHVQARFTYVHLTHKMVLLACAGSQRDEMLYNLGLQHLLLGRPGQAFRCLKEVRVRVQFRMRG